MLDLVYISFDYRSDIQYHPHSCFDFRIRTCKIFVLNSCSLLFSHLLGPSDR